MHMHNGHTRETLAVLMYASFAILRKAEVCHALGCTEVRVPPVVACWVQKNETISVCATAIGHAHMQGLILASELSQLHSFIFSGGQTLACLPLFSPEARSLLVYAAFSSPDVLELGAVDILQSVQ